ncbi:MAG: zinc ABC transporter substrate-binding protein [Clostridia bacterium]|nr:zinc ABC transporter substrate-binding protein [Clostridia bacterium]
MKRKLAAFFAALTLILSSFGVFTACSVEKTDIVVSIFPEYDWVMNILGEKKSDLGVKLLAKSGADLHNFQPKSDDILAIAKCKLFIYVGGESDEWVDEVLAENPNSDRITINLLEVLGENAKIEEPVGDEDHEEEYDEHVWLSLKNAQIFVDEIADAIGKIDGENAGTYTENAAAYKAKLNALDEKYLAATEKAETKTLLFADRFPFRYLVDDYGLSYFAAFSGCSAANSAASLDTIVRLADKLIEHSLNTILIIEGSDGSIARSVIQTAKDKGYTGQVETKVLDSLQAATIKEYESGRNYLAVMESNLSVLSAALKVSD